MFHLVTCICSLRFFLYPSVYKCNNKTSLQAVWWCVWLILHGTRLQCGWPPPSRRASHDIRIAHCVRCVCYSSSLLRYLSRFPVYLRFKLSNNCIWCYIFLPEHPNDGIEIERITISIRFSYDCRVIVTTTAQTCNYPK